MKTPMIAMLLAFCMGAVAQKQPAPNTEDEHFRWSERQAHELDYQHTIASDTALEPAVREALVEYIYRGFKQFDQDSATLDLRKLARDTRIELVDLNGDGKFEILAQGNGWGPCGAVGNCSFWLFEQTRNGVRCLFNSSAEGDSFHKVVVRPWSTNGYRDIVLGTHDGASERDLVWLKFDGAGYRRVLCYHLSWIGDHLEQLKSPEISLVGCAKE